MGMTRLFAGAASLALVLAAPAAAQKEGGKAEAGPPPLSRFTSETLTRFGSEEEFDSYLASVGAHGEMWGARRTPGAIQFAAFQDGSQSDAPAEPICSDPELCPEEPPATAETIQGFSQISVTGARVAATNPSITNNQMAGVDEGDIVKQIGHYLIVLQDGRLFAIDLRPEGRRGMALADRADVYRARDDDAWYDEMLVQGDRIVVTAYSYGQEATEVSVFRLDQSNGRIHREGVFLISSDDYYSGTNYATRLVGDSLVIYTPYGLQRWRSAAHDGRWPTVRRWTPEEERRTALRQGVRLFDARSIYRPVRDVRAPAVHTVSVCPLGPVEAGRNLDCRATAFVAPMRSRLYVTEAHAYVWTADWGNQARPPACSAEREGTLAAAAEATVYRVPVTGAGGPLEVLGARGRPVDQFSLQASDERLYGLLRQDAEACRPHDRSASPRLGFASIPLSRFSQRLRDVPLDGYTPLPSTETHAIANRFTDRYLVYGSLSRGYEARDEDFRFRAPLAFAVPVDRPTAATRLSVPHNVLRAERVGDGIVLTGYRDAGGLRISLVDLERFPRVASTTFLPKRYESEGRSHAFNSRMDADGSGIMGIPTIFQENARERWRSDASDVSFIAADRRGGLRPIGELRGEDEAHHPAYACEVSCIDWYGNSRPIFTDGRIFALSGTEFVEGRIESGRIGETGRIDLTAPPRGR